MNISETRGLIDIRFYLKQHWGEGGWIMFSPDLIRTLVSMAKDSSHRLIMEGNLVITLAPSFSIGSSSLLQVRRTTIKARMTLNFG